MFAYSTGSDDGDNAAGGGPVELITDVNWSEDRFQVFDRDRLRRRHLGAGAGADLQQRGRQCACGAIWAGNGSGATGWPPSSTFGGRTYVAIDQGGAFGSFSDADDLLLDITGATGTIGAGNFTT